MALGGERGEEKAISDAGVAERAACIRGRVHLKGRDCFHATNVNDANGRLFPRNSQQWHPWAHML